MNFLVKRHFFPALQRYITKLKNSNYFKSDSCTFGTGIATLLDRQRMI